MREKNKSGFFLYALIVFIGAMITCMAMNLTGSLLSNIMTDYSIPLERGGLMTFFQHLGGFISLVIVTLIADRLKKPWILAVCIAAGAIALFTLGSIPAYTVFMIMFILFGASICTMDSMQSALIANLYGEKRNMALSVLHGLNGLAGAMLPIMTGSGVDSGRSWNSMYMILGVVFCLTLIPTVGIYLMKRKTIDEKCPVTVSKATPQRGMLKKYFSDKAALLAMLCEFTFSACQIGIMVWSVKYCTEMFSGFSVLACSLSLSAYWGGAAVIRLLLGLVPPFTSIGNKTAIGWFSIIGGAVFFLSILAKNYYCFIIGIFIIGMMTGAVVPRLVGLTCSWYPDYTGMASISIFMAMHLASCSIPLVMGAVASAVSMRTMMFIPAVGAILCGLIGVSLPKEGSRQEPQNSELTENQ